MLGEGEAKKGLRSFSSTKVFLSAGSLRTAACMTTLLGVNWFVCRELFTVEFLRHMGSIEGAFIAISRYTMENWPDLSWWPLWFAGMPYTNTYQPGLHLTVAAVAEVLKLSPALAYHAVTAGFYCLGPVTLFWMAYRLSGRRAYSFSAALLYQDFRFGSSDGTSLHPHPAKRNHFSTRKRRRLRRNRSSPLLAPSWGLIRRCEVNFADTPPSFRPQYTDFAFAKCGATRPAQAAPRSSAACHRTAAGSDAPPPGAASNSARA